MIRTSTVYSSSRILCFNRTNPHRNSLHFSNPNFVTGNSFFSLMERYWMGSGVNKSKAMVEQLQKYGIIRSHKVADVMKTIDRALFVPEGTPPYVDTPIPIGYNATISAPHMHAMCLELLEKNLQPGMHALDVGSGIYLLCSLLQAYPFNFYYSVFTAALLSYMDPLVSMQIAE